MLAPLRQLLRCRLGGPVRLLGICLESGSSRLPGNGPAPGPSKRHKERPSQDDATSTLGQEARELAELHEGEGAPLVEEAPPPSLRPSEELPIQPNSEATHCSPSRWKDSKPHPAARSGSWRKCHNWRASKHKSAPDGFPKKTTGFALEGSLHPISMRSSCGELPVLPS